MPTYQILNWILWQPQEDISEHLKLPWLIHTHISSDGPCYLLLLFFFAFRVLPTIRFCDTHELHGPVSTGPHIMKLTKMKKQKSLPASQTSLAWNSRNMFWSCQLTGLTRVGRYGYIFIGHMFMFLQEKKKTVNSIHWLFFLCHAVTRWNVVEGWRVLASCPWP